MNFPKRKGERFTALGNEYVLDCFKYRSKEKGGLTTADTWEEVVKDCISHRSIRIIPVCQRPSKNQFRLTECKKIQLP